METAVNSMSINGVEYVRKDSVKEEDVKGDIKIVILQRGWTIVGRFERDENNNCKVHNASVIRIWGTTRGLGEIAKSGPTGLTKLDKCYGVVQCDYLTVVATIDCERTAWESEL